MSHLEYGSVAWVRLGQAWWPGTITTLEKCPPEFVEGIRKTPVAVVKFFRENEFHDVSKEEHIYPYSCERKMEFIKRGQYINKNQSHGEVDLLTKFESDVVTAEKLTGGDMNILETIGEVMDSPSNPCIPEPDLSPDPQSTHVERPRGCLPGEIVIGEPEGPTHIQSIRMRSPHSNNTQLDLGKQDASDDSDCYIEEEIEQVPALRKEMQCVGDPQPGSHFSDSFRLVVQSRSKFSDVKSRRVGDLNELNSKGRDQLDEGVRTDLSSSDFDDESKVREVAHSDSMKYGSPKEFSYVHKKTDVDIGVEVRQFTRTVTDNGSHSYASRNTHGYSYEIAPQSPEVIEVESEPQSPEVIEEEEFVPQPSEVIEEECVPQPSEVIEEECVPQPSEVVEEECVPQPSDVIEEECVPQPSEVIEEECDLQYSEIMEEEEVVSQGSEAVVDTGALSSMFVEEEIGGTLDDEEGEALGYDTVTPQVSDSVVQPLSEVDDSALSDPDYLDNSDRMVEISDDDALEVAPRVSSTPQVSDSVVQPLSEVDDSALSDPNHLDNSDRMVEISDDDALEVAPQVSETGVFGKTSDSSWVEKEQIATALPHAPKVVNDKYLHVSNENNGECLEVSEQDSYPILSDEDVEIKDSDSVREPVSEADSVVKENTSIVTEKQLSAMEKDLSCIYGVELPDQSDSEQVVTSSGMDGDLDDNQELMDDSCDSSANDTLGLGDNQERESEHELTINESLKSSAELSSSRANIEEADSSFSDVENCPAEEAVSVSKTETPDKDSLKVVGEKVKTPERGKSTRQKSVPKRKREPSHKRSKKLKVDAKEESPADNTLEDEELPDLLLTSTKAGDKKLKTGDLVWVKYRKDWWPSYIKNVYARDRKFSIVFVACDQNSGIRVNSRNVRKLYVWDVPSFVNQNQEGFSSALHLCKLFQKLHDQGNEIPAHDFFNRSPQAQVALLNQKKSPKTKGKASPDKKQKTKTACTTPKSAPKKSIFDAPDFKLQMSAREKNKLQSALKARKADNQKLVKFMKSRPCVDYLWKIYNEEVVCERHEQYKDHDLRKTLLWTGIGPFQLDDGDEQILSVISVYRDEILSKKPRLSDAGDYAFRVWIPEAIKEALRVVKKVPESELDEALDKGYRETPIEKKARKLSF